MIELKTELANYKQQMDMAIAQLFQNEQGMKAGLDSAEANLRVFQKVINGVQEGTILLLPVPLTEVSDGQPVPLPKINWPEYYKLVDAEMQAMAAAAREIELKRTQDRLKVLIEAKKFDWLKERVAKQISDQKVEDAVKEQQMQNAARFFEAAQVHIDRAKKGEPYDTLRLDQLVGMIASTERKEAAENGGAHQDEPPAEALGRLSDEDDEHNGDTVVFGGDVEAPMHEVHDA